VLINLKIKSMKGELSRSLVRVIHSPTKKNMKEKNKVTNYGEDLSFEEDCDYNGICDDIPGTHVSSFNFAKEATLNEVLIKEAIATSSPSNNISSNNILSDNRKLKTEAPEITPPINGEPFDIQRSYKIRKSTARMLNEIKAIHPNVNVYMNTIVDAALRNYYDYIFNKDGMKTL